MKRRTAIAALSTAVLLAWLPAARSADAIDVLSARLEPSPDGESWLLSADFAVSLSAQLEDAVNRGVSLSFLVEFQLTRRFGMQAAGLKCVLGRLVVCKDCRHLRCASQLARPARRNQDFASGGVPLQQQRGQLLSLEVSRGGAFMPQGLACVLL